MTGQAKDALRQCQAIFGSERAAKEAAEEAPDASVIKEYQPEKILSWLEDHPQTTRCAAVYSGDTGFYSGAQGLLKALEEKNNGQEKVLDRIVLETLLSGLNDQEKDVILRRYYYSQTQAEIAAVLHISQVQVSRLEKRILKKMREQL